MDSDDYFPSQLLLVFISEPIISSIIILVIVLLLVLFACLLSVGERALFYPFLREEMDENRDDRDDKYKYIRQVIEHSRQIHHAVSFVRSVIIILLFGALLPYAHAFLCGQMLTADREVLIALGLAVLLYVLCEVLPKCIVRNNELYLAQKAAPHFLIINRICRPITQYKMPQATTAHKNDASANESAIISKDTIDEKEMLEDIIHFYNKTADEIMVPRLDMTSVDSKCDIKEVLEIIKKTGYSRIPVYEETEDDIVGVLYVKDLLTLIDNTNTSPWQNLVRPPYFIPETKKIDGLLEEFRSNKVHIAIVVDEFGCASGLVTMEDIIEEIIGEISDEYDTDEKNFFVLPDGSYIFEGKIQLNDFFRETDIDEEVFGKLTEEVETLAGLLLKIKVTLPRKREIIDYKNYRFRILEADERRVLKIKFSIIDEPDKKKRVTGRSLIGIFFLVLCISCSDAAMPKPRGFYRIDIPEAHYLDFSPDELPYSFHVSQLVTVELPPLDATGGWMNLSYETLNAKLYCSYQQITPGELSPAENECRELVARTVRTADAIKEQAYENQAIHVYGTLFEIDGDAVSPIQFMLTDSNNHFFRGALYYQCKPNVDSLAPVTRYLQNDMIELIQSFHWK
ncbi:MAG: CBS domain-containing protein [Tannerella sp.]|nr:CBS domain-containing protein [Tannerella sp.]